MNDNDLQKMFEQADRQKPDELAKRRAIAAAMTEFSSVTNSDTPAKTEIASDENNELLNKKLKPGKGFRESLRLTGNTNVNSRKKHMTKNYLNWRYSSVAAASVLLFAGYISFQMPGIDQENTDFRIPELDVDEDIASKDLAASIPVDREADSRALLSKKEQKRKQVAVAPTMAGSVDNYSAEESGIAKPLALSAPAPARVRSFSLQLAEKSMSHSPPILGDRDQVGPNGVPVDDRERFENTAINSVKRVSEDPVSTFSIDVDTASYSFVRRKLNSGVLPEKDAVRVEEFLNYFDYDYPVPQSQDTPFATHVLVGDSPWKAGNKLMHIGIKGYELSEQPKSNLVFLLDVSGSMESEDKLPLVKKSLGMLLSKLRDDDTVSIVVYASAVGTVLEPTKVKDKQKILGALKRLSAGGSTSGAQGIQLAYELAEQNFDKTAVNRIILATDGDFNVGISDPKKLQTFVERKRKQGIYLSVLGFGQGNYHDHMMQSLAQNGNGIAAYIDTLSEAQKVLVDEATSSLFPIANDVKIQIEFNPETVEEYRLIGYETRQLKREDFNNDKVDAGDIGAGHTVTAIYEITPKENATPLIDGSRYQKEIQAKAGHGSEYALLKLRYKLPGEDRSLLIEKIVSKADMNFEEASWQKREFEFSAAVAGFAQLLKDDRYLEAWSLDDALTLALQSRGDDAYGYRSELVQLIRSAKVAKAM